MPSQYTGSISYGSHKDVGGKRKKLYQTAANRLEGGNLSRMICRIVDSHLGLELPLPFTGRPRKNHPK